MIDIKRFRQLELINVKCDVYIDDEEYEKVFEIIRLGEKNTVEEELKRELGDETAPAIKVRNKCNKYLLEKRTPRKTRFFVEGIDLTAKDYKSWLPLFRSKAVRAYLSRDGRDAAMAGLDDILMYLHHYLPVFQKNENQKNNALILQHLYFQELAACGKPGLESLGYALRAADILNGTKTISPNHYNKELYELWSKLNQGIGYWHSRQRMNAALAFNSIIKEFDDKTVKDLLKQFSDDERESWRRLLYDQAVLFRAELQESLQFSYHTIKTLTRLSNAKKEKRLIKEALAYRDMRRFDEALKEIRELLWGSKKSENSAITLKVIFDRFEHWQCENKKAGISSEIAGLLFDFYLAKFEDQDPDDDDIDTFTKKMRKYSAFLMKSKPERTSYLSQVARYLRWLSDKHGGKLDGDSCRKQIDALYSRFRGNIKLDKLDKTLKDFDVYNYDRFVDSLEKFYRNCSRPDMESDERKFLDKVKLFEREKFYLYDFKELERKQRIRTLDEGLTKNCLTPSTCFYGKDDRQFHGLLHCNETNTKQKGKPEQTREFATDEVKELKDHDYETIMTKENENFLEYLKYKSSHPIPKAVSPDQNNACSYHFMGLQRWNSQTPTLTLSKGGGYLLYKQDKNGAVQFGMAIDPGFNFVDNLFHMGFTLKDIDFILLTHAHLDHIRDFEPIVSALLDLKKRAPEEKKVKGKIHAIMSLGVYRKLENIITNTVLREFLADTYIVDIEREIVDREKDGYLSPIRFLNQNGGLVSILDDKDDNFQVKIIPTRAYHDDNSERSDSFGYIIEVKDDDCKFSFGYTGDTRWHEEDIGLQYSQCDVVCIHIGALIESEDEKNEKNKFGYYRGRRCEELIEKKWHPYLFGLLRWIKAIKTSNNKNRLILLSEFGEELKGGIRIDLIRRLNKMFAHKERVCIPVDIGLNVVLGRYRSGANTYQVWCFGCESFVNAMDIRYRHFGYGRGDEALFYFCETCLKSRPTNILRDKMQHICDLGIPLRKQ